MRLGGGQSLTDLAAEGNPVDRVVYMSLLILGLLVLLVRKDRVARSVRHNWPVLLFFAYALVSMVWSDFPDVGFKRWTKALGDFVMVLIVWTDLHPTIAMRRILARTAYILIPLSILFNKYYPSIGRLYGRYSGATMYIGVAGDKNGLGAICLVFGLATLWRLFLLYGDERRISRRRGHLTVQYVILLMVVYLFLKINSMTSLSCFLIATCLMFAARSRVFKRNPILIHFIIAAMVAVPISVELLGVSPDMLHAIGRNATLTERTDIWAAVIKLVPNRWLGAGYGSFWIGPRVDTMIEQVTHWWVPNQAHNGYLEVFVNLGWIGVFFLAVVILWGYRSVIRAWRLNLPLGNLMLAYFVCGIVFNITEAAFFRMLFPMWVFLLAALTMPRTRDLPALDLATQELKESLSEEVLEPIR